MMVDVDLAVDLDVALAMRNRPPPIRMTSRQENSSPKTARRPFRSVGAAGVLITK